MLAAVQTRLRSEESGFGIIEVLVSSLIVVIVSLGVLAAVDAAGRTAETNRARTAASNVATADQERLRSMTIAAITRLNSNRSVNEDGIDFTVNSKVEYVTGTGASTECGSSEAAPRVLKMTSTVTWTGQRIDPVTQTSLRALPTGTLADRGSLAVDINDRTGTTGIANQTVTLTGPETRSGTTNANGCVIFGYLQPGTYTIAFQKTGYIESKRPFRSAISDSVVVAADGVASAAYQYDRPGRADVVYRTSTFGTTTDNANTNGTGFVLSTGLMGTPNFSVFTHASAQTGSAGTTLFPYTTPYEAWAGKCYANRPPDGSRGSVTVTPAGTVTGVKVREYRVRIRLRRRTNASGTATYATVPAPGTGVTTNVILTPVNAGCTENTAATHVSSTGSGNTSVSTWEAIVPWGAYNVCAQYWASSSSANKGRITDSVTTTEAGATDPSTTTTLDIPYSSTPNTCP